VQKIAVLHAGDVAEIAASQLSFVRQRNKISSSPEITQDPLILRAFSVKAM